MRWSRMSFALMGALFLCFTLNSPLVLATEPVQQPPRDLVVLNWSEYLDPDLISEFEQQHNAKITEVYFESDDLRDDMLLETSGQGYDVAIVNGANMETYRKRGWLAPLTEQQVPNLRHVDARWLDAFEGVRGHAAPHFWGTTGIAYRKDLVEKPITSWMELYKPAEYLRGKIGMVENARDTIGMALKALGYSANSSDTQELEAAEQLLLEQKPYVRNYGYLLLSEDSALVSGELIATILYSGDALMVQEHQPEVEYVVPEEGGNIWVDYLVVLEGSGQKDLAWQFIDFLNQPENAARLAEYVYYATPNKAAEKLLPAEFLEDPIIYPDAASLKKSEFYTPLPAAAVRKRNLIFSGVRQQ